MINPPRFVLEWAALVALYFFCGINWMLAVGTGWCVFLALDYHCAMSFHRAMEDIVLEEIRGDDPNIKLDDIHLSHSSLGVLPPGMGFRLLYKLKTGQIGHSVHRFRKED